MYFLKWIIDSFLPPPLNIQQQQIEKEKLQQKICFHTEFKSGFIGFGVEPILLLYFFILLLLDKYLENFSHFPQHTQHSIVPEAIQIGSKKNTHRTFSKSKSSMWFYCFSPFDSRLDIDFGINQLWVLPFWLIENVSL